MTFFSCHRVYVMVNDSASSDPFADVSFLDDFNVDLLQEQLKKDVGGCVIGTRQESNLNYVIEMDFIHRRVMELLTGRYYRNNINKTTNEALSYTSNAKDIVNMELKKQDNGYCEFVTNVLKSCLDLELRFSSLDTEALLAFITNIHLRNQT